MTESKVSALELLILECLPDGILFGQKHLIGECKKKNKHVTTEAVLKALKDMEKRGLVESWSVMENGRGVFGWSAIVTDVSSAQ